MFPTRSQADSILAGIFQKPFKIMFSYFLFRELCEAFSVSKCLFVFVFTLTAIFLQCPHDSFRVA